MIVHALQVLVAGLWVAVASVAAAMGVRYASRRVAGWRPAAGGESGGDFGGGHHHG